MVRPGGVCFLLLVAAFAFLQMNSRTERTQKPTNKGRLPRRKRPRRRNRRRLPTKQKAAALQNESAALAALSNASRSTSPALATKLALAAWPRNTADHRPKLDVAVAALSAAVLDLRERKVLSGHDGAVQSAAFSPDGARVVTASEDKTARVWDAATGKAIAVLSGHDDPVCERRLLAGRRARRHGLGRQDGAGLGRDDGPGDRGPERP